MNPAIVLLIVMFYFCMVIGVSWLTTRRGNGDARSFYRGDRRSPWWVVAVAMIGTSISGVTYVSVPGMVASGSMAYMQMVLGFVVGYFVVAYVLLPLYYRLNLSSIYEYLDQRYGISAHRTGAGFFLLSKFLGCAVRMYLTAVVLQVVLFGGLGVPFWANVASIMGVVWLYSFRGGVKTLVWTDLLQTLCLFAAMIGFVVCTAQAMGLSADGVFKLVSSSPMNRVWFFDDANDTRFFWKQFLGGVFTTVAMTGLDQDMMQKNLSCRTLRQAQKNMVCYGFGFIPVNLVFLTLGILLYTYAAQLGVTVAKSDELFPLLATGINPQTGESYLPIFVSVLFVLGLIAAAFSSAGSAVTSLTTAIMVDFRVPLLRRFRVHLVNSVLMGLAIYAFHLLASGSVINAVYVVASYTYGPLLGLFFFGLFTHRKVREASVPFVCVVSPILCFVLDSNSQAWFNGYKIGYELLVINGLITALGLLLFSFGGSRTQLQQVSSAAKDN